MTAATLPWLEPQLVKESDKVSDNTGNTNTGLNVDENTRHILHAISSLKHSFDNRMSEMGERMRKYFMNTF